jgi:hypothetical protein
MPLPSHGGNDKPTMAWTFQEIVNWQNQQDPGSGDQFLEWVRTHNTVPAPYVLDVNSNTFGPGGLGANNHALNWYAAWILLGNVGPGIGKAIGTGINKVGQQIPKSILPGVAAGIGSVPGAHALSGLDAIGNFFSQLGQANTWIRVAEFVIGAGLIIVSIAKLSSGTAVGKAAVSVGKAAAIL